MVYHSGKLYHTILVYHGIPWYGMVQFFRNQNGMVWYGTPKNRTISIPALGSLILGTFWYNFWGGGIRGKFFLVKNHTRQEIISTTHNTQADHRPWGQPRAIS